jgi:flagellar hook assembly protein FlgD
VKLSVYDVRGRLVRVLVDSERKPGRHTVVWDGRNGRGEMIASGIYFYTLRSGSRVYTKKMAALK